MSRILAQDSDVTKNSHDQKDSRTKTQSKENTGQLLFADFAYCGENNVESLFRVMCQGKRDLLHFYIKSKVMKNEVEKALYLL